VTAATRHTTLRIAITLIVLGAAIPVAAQFGGGLSLDGWEDRRSQARVTPLVSGIEVGGIQRVDVKAVRNQIKLRSGDRLSSAVVAADVGRIFQMGLFEDVRVGIKKLKGPGDKVVVRYQVLERPSIAKISIEGNEEQGKEAILKVVDLKVNDLYSPSQAHENVNKIRELYVEEGFFLATVQLRAEPVKGNQVHVVFEIHERAEVTVRQIEILDNSGLTDEDIKAVMRTKEGSILNALGQGAAFKREQLEQDTQIIQYLYLTKGYIQAKVFEPTTSLSRDMRFIRISIRVQEGPRFEVGKIAVKGDSVVETDKLLAKVQLKSGDIFNYAHVQQDSKMLSAAQKEHGYAYATVSNESIPHMKKRTVDWTYHVQKGHKIYFGRISMVGAATTRDKVIRRELLFTEGQMYSERKIGGSKTRVQRLGFFEKVEIKTRPTRNPRVVDVEIEVKERTTGTFQVGAGFSSADQFITTAQISKDNFLGRGQRMSLQAQLSAIRTMFQGSFFEPYFLDTNVTFALELYNFEQLFMDFSRNSTGGSLSWGYRLLPTLHVDLTYNLEQVRTQIGGLMGRRDVPMASLFNSGLTSSVRASISYDDRNDRMFPTRGWFLALTSEFASSLLASENLFDRYTAQVRRYFPMPFDSVLKFNIVGGYVRAPPGQPVPLFERFFIGGIFNVRGYQRNTLGPSIGVPQSSDPAAPLSAFNIGGNKQFYMNNELEVPLVQAPVNLRGLLFFDVGNAFGEGQPIDFEQMRMSFGWGVRWFSPVGPLRFEWGIPLNPLPGEEPLVFAFTIGNSF
jgi:outer membrane protein insertion porin family